MALVIYIVTIVVIVVSVALRLSTNKKEWGTLCVPFEARDHFDASVYRSATLKNKVILEQLKELLLSRGLNPLVFGSSVRGRRFVYRHRCYHTSDVDLMVEVDSETFVQWVKMAYGDDVVGYGDPAQYACGVGCCVYYHGKMLTGLPGYDKHSPTREPRKKAAEAVLGIKFPSELRVDVFFFPHEFVRGEMSIPEWERPERNFREEVLRGVPLGRLRPGRVSIREFFSL